MRWVTAGFGILVASYLSACSGESASDDDEGGSGGDPSGSEKGGTGGTTGGTGNVGKGGGSVGGTGGGGLESSGLPKDAYLDELTAEQLHTLCAWAIPLQGGPGKKQCDDSITVTTDTVEQCSADTITIHCSVGMVEACALSLNGDACALLTSAPCEAYIACATQ